MIRASRGSIAALSALLAGSLAAAPPATPRRDPFLGPVLLDTQGRQVRLDAFKGKVRVFDIWASWCGPCRMGIPALNELYERYRGRDLVVFGISVDDSPGDVVRFTKSIPIRYPNAMMNRDAERLFGLDGGGSIPITLIIDREGKIRRKFVGLVSAEAIAREVEPLL